MPLQRSPRRKLTRELPAPRAAGPRLGGGVNLRAVLRRRQRRPGHAGEHLRPPRYSAAGRCRCRGAPVSSSAVQGGPQPRRWAQSGPPAVVWCRRTGSSVDGARVQAGDASTQTGLDGGAITVYPFAYNERVNRYICNRQDYVDISPISWYTITHGRRLDWARVKSN